MKKTTLRNQSECDCTTSKTHRISPIKIPKKVLTSKTWKSRNDSSKINAVLHPEDHNNTPRMKYHDKFKGNVTKKCCLSSNTCYCKEINNVPRPSLIPKPTSCVSKSTLDRNISVRDLKRSSLSCVCKGKEEHQTKESLRERISKMKQNKTHQNYVELGYSNQRLNYEQYREDQEDKYLQEIEDYRENERLKQRSKECGIEISENEYYMDQDGRKKRFSNMDIDSSTEVNTILGTQNYETDSSITEGGYTQTSEDPNLRTDLRNIPSSKNTPDNFKFASDLENYYLPDNQFKDFENSQFRNTESKSEFGNYYRYMPDIRSKETQYEKVPKFRKTHFFETHNIGRLGQNVEEHTCIHQFVLDERMLPEPLNKDVFGRSMCKVCEKPMEGTSNADKSFFDPSFKPTKSNVRNLAKCTEYGLSPKLIQIGNGKSKIELVLGKNDLDALSNVVHRLKRTEYCNSLALRQQKMRLI